MVGHSALDTVVGNNGSVTTGIRAPGARPKLDQICAEAVDLARDAITDDVAGPYIQAVAEGERLVTHYFECVMPAYRGWRCTSSTACRRAAYSDSSTPLARNAKGSHTSAASRSVFGMSNASEADVSQTKSE